MRSLQVGGDTMGPGKRVFSMHVVTVTAAAVALVGMTTASAPRARAALAPSGHTVASGARLWAKRYTGPTLLREPTEIAAAASPDSKTVFVTGTDVDGFVTVAYNAASGAQRWHADFGVEFDTAEAIAVSPNGKTVFVTGTTGADGGYATVAYGAASGTPLWMASYAGPGVSTSVPSSIAASSSSVFVTGYTDEAGLIRYATVAYNAATGARRWSKLYRGPGSSTDSQATKVAVAPNGTAVFVTGWTTNSRGSSAATIAYRSSGGAQLWSQRYADVSSGAVSMVVSPNGKSLYLAGSYFGDCVTVGYKAAGGKRLWAKRYTPADCRAYSIAISPNDGTVYVAGYYSNDVGLLDYLTVAYKATTGAQRWAKRYHRAGLGSIAYAVAASRSGKKVYVTGESQSGSSPTYVTTIAYSTGSGGALWVRRYASGPQYVGANAYSLQLGPNGRDLFVSTTGESNNVTGFLTLAYAG
jgi:hypothetical protein